MKYLIVHSNLGLGGQEKMIVYLANMLSETDEVTLLLLDYKEQYFKLRDSVNVIRHSGMYKVFDSDNSFTKSLSIIKKATSVIKKTQKETAAEIVIAFDDRITWLTWLTFGFSNVKTVYSQRNDPYDKSKLKNRIFKIIYTFSSGVVFQLNEVKLFYKLKGKKYCIIPNPVFGEICEYNNSKKKKIISAGRFQDRKRFDILIKAFEGVHHKYPEYELYIFGDGAERDNLLKLIDQLGLSKVVHLPGVMKNVIEENKDALMFVLPSDAEGMPNILIEAMAAGIPCISTDCTPGGASFLIGNNERGLLIPRGDIVELENAIVTYISNSDVRKEKSDKASRFLHQLKKEIIDEKWRRFLDNVCGE